jgi:hypothetical protein
MPQPRNALSIYQEGRMSLAISSINSRQLPNEKSAARVYDVPRSTLRDRRAGKTARRDCEPNSKILTRVEELVIVERILDLVSRGSPPSIPALHEMANNLLIVRGASKAGKNFAENFAENFVKRTPELQIAYSRKYDRQRALCEDPGIIMPWFELVRNVRLKYGIADAHVPFR